MLNADENGIFDSVFWAFFSFSIFADDEHNVVAVLLLKPAQKIRGNLFVCCLAYDCLKNVIPMPCCMLDAVEFYFG